LVDEEGIVRAKVPFRRVESMYSVKQIGVNVTILSSLVVNSMQLF